MADFHKAFQKAIGSVSDMEPEEPEGGYAEGYADAKGEALAIMSEALSEELGELIDELKTKEILLGSATPPHDRGIHIFRY